MIHNCVHQGCHNTFDYVNGGQIYSLERRPQGKTEFIWICADCKPKFAVVLSPEGEVDVVARESRTHKLPPNPMADLRPFPDCFSGRRAA